MAAGTTIAAGHCSGRASGICRRPFRGIDFDLKQTLPVHAFVLLSHPLDHSVSHSDP